MSQSPLIIVYDGECPLCQLGVRTYRLREAVGEITLVDKRTEREHPIIQEIRDHGFKVDQGMVVKWRDKLYQGADAIHILATLSNGEGVVNGISRPCLPLAHHRKALLSVAQGRAAPCADA